MRSPPQYMRNGESPHTPRFPAPHFQSTLSIQKLRRFNLLILVFRLAAFCFCFASAAFMVSSTRGSPHWYDYDAFRYLLAASAIVTVYSLFEMGASVWEISRGATLLPETLQIWFDFGHDQVFAYLLLSAAAAGTELSRRMKENSTCSTSSTLCVQTEIAIALGFAGFLFLAFTSLLSGFRVVCFIINGTRFHL